MLSERVARWLDRRIPPARSVTLNQKSIFIFPTLEGLLFCVLLLILLLTAINYQNNMIYLLTFLLVSLLHVIIYHSYQNLSGLKFSFKQAESVFAGETCYFEVTVSSGKNRMRHFSITARWPDESVAVAPDVSSDKEVIKLAIPMTALQRGWLTPGRLLVETRYPFGLIRAWSWIDLECEALIYPQPIEGSPDRMGSDAREGEQLQAQPGVEDFKGIRTYAPGDSLKRVDWKKYAKRGDVLIKEFERPVSDSHYFSLDDYAGQALEKKLSHLCFDVVSAAKSGVYYGLDLKSERIEPDSGSGHERACLRALALCQLSSTHSVSGG